MKTHYLTLTFFILSNLLYLSSFAHSVQVAYCISCSGQLRLYVEHWHGSANPSSTTMTIQITVDGVTTSSTGSPVANLQNIPFAQLPNCASPPTVFASCPSRANTYNDWVVYDYPNVPVGANVQFTIISGNSAFTADGCGMYPATSPNFIVQPLNQPPITVNPVVTCSGASAPGINFPPGNPPGGTYIWSNDNPAIGIPATGSGNIPPFNPPVSSTTQVANITVSYLCATTQFTVTVLPTAAPNFNFVNFSTSQSGTSQCLGDSTQFTAQVTPGVTIQSALWDFGDGTTSTDMNPKHLFPATGNYTVSLTMVTTDGCTQTTSSSVTVHPKPAVNFTATSSCLQDATVFTNSSSISPPDNISNWNWNFGDNTTSTLQNPTHTYSSSGTHAVSLVATSNNNCIDSISHTITVYDLPVASFTSSTECLNDATLFSDASTYVVPASSWEWDFDNNGTTDNTQQNTSFTYSGFGFFNVKFKVTDINGCSDDTITAVEVKPLPVADFSSTNECPFFPSSLTDNSSVAGGATINQWFWDISNDGSVEYTSQNANHSWNAGGTYYAELKVITADGCKDSIVKPITIYPKPVAEFSNTTVCFGSTTNFTDASYVNLNDNITNWNWNFGDNATSTIQNPTHDYNSFGIYDVELIVETNNGCKDTVNKNVEVYAMPTANFSMQNTCEYTPVNFTNLTSIPSNEVLIYLWNFGDNSFLAIDSPTHQYSMEGNYDVTLTATSPNGCSHDTTISFTIYDEPFAQFSLSNGCVYDDFTFGDLSTTTDNITSWQWNFDDGSTSNQPSPTHHFNSEGIYDIQLVVTTANNCSDTNTIGLEVYPQPVANFTPTDVCLNTPTVFNDISTVSNSVFSNEYVLEYSEWDFGDGNTGLGHTITHTYSNAGYYNSQMIATSFHGCKDTAYLTVIVHNNPVAQFSISDSLGCNPVTANFTNLSSIINSPQNYTLSYEWYFENGDSSNLENPSSTFINNSHTDPLDYGVSLVVTSNIGCKDSIHRDNVVTVYPVPLADFNFSPENIEVYNAEVSFIDNSEGADMWNWYFGDGFTESVSSPTHIYADSGYFNVGLAIENNYGCKNSISKTIRVKPVFEVFIPNSITPNGDGKNDMFLVDGYGINDVEMYIYDKWGQLIFEGFNKEEGWDGFVKGKQNKTGVYVYLIKLEDLFGETHIYKGSVTVVF